MVALWASLSIVILPLLTKTIRGVRSLWKIYRGIDPTSGLYLAQRDRFIQTLGRYLPALPDVVIVDDLDRASVDQQRSFLRAMARFSRELGFAVVVCMDESELLAAPPDPEGPEELPRKTITAELRIPDRSREDIALLSAVCAREFAKNNQPASPALAASLTSVQFVADLTRVLLLDSLDSPASPRKVWRILTSVVLQAGNWGFTQLTTSAPCYA